MSPGWKNLSWISEVVKVSTIQKLTPAELRKFGFVTAAMVLVFFELLIPWIWNLDWPIWPLVVAGILVLFALVTPATLGPFYKVWMKFAEILGWINTRIILGFIFFVFFLPFGIVMRLFNDPMRRKMDDSKDTYRVTSKSPKTENLEKPF